MIRHPPRSTLFPSTPLFRSPAMSAALAPAVPPGMVEDSPTGRSREPMRSHLAFEGAPTCTECGMLMTPSGRDRKSTRLNSSHGYISYAVFCLKKKKKRIQKRLNLKTHKRQTHYRNYLNSCRSQFCHTSTRCYVQHAFTVPYASSTS